MNQIVPFDFNGQQIRIVMDGEDYHFVALDAAAVLGYSDPFEMTKRLDNDEKQNRQIAGFGPRGVTLISESGLYAAVLGSHKPEAKAFKKWITREVLPEIRRTGGYQARTGIQRLSKMEVELAGAEAFVRMLKPAPSSQVAMLTHIIKSNGGDPTFLPAYVVDGAAGTGGSSMATKPLTALLREHGIRIGVRAFNQLLADAGYLAEMTRKSTSARATDGIKHFWTITDAGLQYGKNLTNPGNPRETQPHWYVDRFRELVAAVSTGT